MATELITATQAAAVSAQIDLAPGDSMQVHVSESLQGTEQVYLEYSTDNGLTWLRVSDDRYGGVLCTARVNRQVVNGPGTFRVGKEPTAAVVGVFRD